MAKERPEVVKIFIRALVGAEIYTHRNKEETTELIMKRFKVDRTIPASCSLSPSELLRLNPFKNPSMIGEFKLLPGLVDSVSIFSFPKTYSVGKHHRNF